MLSFLLTKIKNFFNKTYVSALEFYIVNNNPQNQSDIERLTKEFNYKT